MTDVKRCTSRPLYSDATVCVSELFYGILVC